MVTQHCKRVILLNEGRIIRAGPAQEVVGYYNVMCASSH